MGSGELAAEDERLVRVLVIAFPFEVCRSNDPSKPGKLVQEDITTHTKIGGSNSLLLTTGFAGGNATTTLGMSALVT